MQTVSGPTVLELRKFIIKVPSYPLSTRQLLKIAIDNHASSHLRNFYRKFDINQKFESEEDLLARTEQIEIWQRDQKDMPNEYPLVPFED